MYFVKQLCTYIGNRVQHNFDLAQHILPPVGWISIAADDLMTLRLGLTICDTFPGAHFA